MRAVESLAIADRVNAKSSALSASVLMGFVLRIDGFMACGDGFVWRRVFVSYSALYVANAAPEPQRSRSLMLIH